MEKNQRARKLHTLREHTHMVTSVAWSPDSERVVSVGADKMLVLCHVKSGTRIQRIKAHSAYVRCRIPPPLHTCTYCCVLAYKYAGIKSLAV
jgi:WD40 repeat protein